MTYTVLVIDDIPLIRKAIVRTMDWAKLNCVVVGEAEDGIEGQQMIRDLKPDILVTDIRLPGLNGLDLAKLMSTDFPLSKTILITGYQDFEYTKKAIRLGVYDFILKPIDNDELSQIVESAINEIQNRRSEKAETDKIATAFVELEKQRHNIRPSLRSKLIADLLTGSKAEEIQVLEEAKNLDVSFNRYALLMVRINEKNGSGSSVECDKIKKQLQVRLSALALTIAAKREFELIESLHNNELMFVYLFPKYLPQREIRMKLQNFCYELIERAKEQEKTTCFIAFSSAYKSLLELPEANREISSLMDASFFQKDRYIFFTDQVQQVKERGKTSIIQDLEQFNQILENTSNEEVKEHTERLLKQLAIYSEGNILVLKGLISEVCLSVVRHYFRVTGDEMGIGKSVDHILGDIYRLTSLKDASAYLNAFIGEIKTKLKQDDKEYSLVVKKVINYINNHYSDNINLTSIADHFSFSTGYLSRLLRTETGINFIDLLTKVRIEAAKRLLMDTKNKVNEVGEMVGYKEYAYFYQVFKRVEGQSPKEYKNRTERSSKSQKN